MIDPAPRPPLGTVVGVELDLAVVGVLEAEVDMVTVMVPAILDEVDEVVDGDVEDEVVLVRVRVEEEVVRVVDEREALPVARTGGAVIVRITGTVGLAGILTTEVAVFFAIVRVLIGGTGTDVFFWA